MQDDTKVGEICTGDPPPIEKPKRLSISDLIAELEPGQHRLVRSTLKSVTGMVSRVKIITGRKYTCRSEKLGIRVYCLHDDGKKPPVPRRDRPAQSSPAS